MELPAEGELERVINAALNGFFQDVHQRICDALAPEVRVCIDSLLVVHESAALAIAQDLRITFLHSKWPFSLDGFGLITAIKPRI